MVRLICSIFFCLAAIPFINSTSLAFENKTSYALSHYIMAVVHEDLGEVGKAIEEYKRSPEGIRTMVKKHRNQMIGGAVSFVIGIAITVGTFQLATSGGTGGYFFIFYGPVIWGIVYFITGLVGYVKYKGMDTSQQM